MINFIYMKNQTTVLIFDNFYSLNFFTLISETENLNGQMKNRVFTNVNPDFETPH